MWGVSTTSVWLQDELFVFFCHFIEIFLKCVRLWLPSKTREATLSKKHILSSNWLYATNFPSQHLLSILFTLVLSGFLLWEFLRSKVTMIFKIVLTHFQENFDLFFDFGWCGTHVNTDMWFVFIRYIFDVQYLMFSADENLIFLYIFLLL